MPDIMRTRELYESYQKGSDLSKGRGRQSFVTIIRHGLGLCDAKGNNYLDENRNRTLRESKFKAELFSLEELGTAIIGSKFKEYMNPSDRGSLARYQQFRNLTEAIHDDNKSLLESVGVGIDVSSMADISAWVGTVGGLIERKILEAFNNPDYIGDELMPTEPSRIPDGQKVIGISRIGDVAEERQPGMPHRRALVGERYVTLGKTRENALACDCTKEAAFFDLTGQVLEHASQVGEWIRWRKEIDQLSAFAGVTTTSTGKWKFSYGGTAYNTYSTSQTIGLSTLTNQQSNELLDWESVQASWLLFLRATDPETATRINVMPDTVVVNPAKLATAVLIQQATETQRRTGYATVGGTGNATQSAAAELNVMNGAGNPVQRFGFGRILFSPLLEQICTNLATDPKIPGLGLSQANANKYWWHFKRDKFLKYMSNWPLSVQSAPANTYDMIDRGIVASYFANERGMPSVWSPWHAVLNTN